MLVLDSSLVAGNSLEPAWGSIDAISGSTLIRGFVVRPPPLLSLLFLLQTLASFALSSPNRAQVPPTAAADCRSAQGVVARERGFCSVNFLRPVIFNTVATSGNDLRPARESVETVLESNWPDGCFLKSPLETAFLILLQALFFFTFDGGGVGS